MPSWNRGDLHSACFRVKIFACGLLVPGLGIVMAGHLRLAVMFNVIYFVVSSLVGWTLVTHAMAGIYVSIGLTLLWFPASALLGVLVRRRAARYQTGTFYVVYVVVTAGIASTFAMARPQLQGFQIYRAVDAIVDPLTAGDCVVVDPHSRDIQRGTIVVYEGFTGPTIAAIFDSDSDSFVLRCEEQAFCTQETQRRHPRSELLGRVVSVFASADGTLHLRRARWLAD